MKTFEGKVAVVTGAGSGIGQQLAFQLAAAGATIILVDNQAARLEETHETIEMAGGKATAQVVDVSKKDQVYALAENVVREFGQVDIVINNAGVALGLVPIEDISYEEMEWLLGINLWGVIYGTKAFLPYLKKQPEAALVNVSSVFGLAGIPMQAPYVIAKFGVRGFTETLRAEMIGESDLLVMVVHPGGIKTNIARDARHRGLDEEAIRQFNSRFDKNARTSAEKAAQVIIEGIRKRKPRVLIGSDARWMDRIVRFSPARAVATFARMTRRFDQGGDFF